MSTVTKTVFLFLLSLSIATPSFANHGVNGLGGLVYILYAFAFIASIPVSGFAYYCSRKGYIESIIGLSIIGILLATVQLGFVYFLNFLNTNIQDFTATDYSFIVVMMIVPSCCIYNFIKSISNKKPSL
jgi:hypothetical protein